MFCKKCKLNISADCCYDDICVFCYHNIDSWDSNGTLITKDEAIRPFICLNCQRMISNQEFLRDKGCKFCVPEKKTKYCNGKY